jgi:nicotinate phosphoribosyltransferase
MRSTHTGLFTDFYELAMAQAYFFEGKAEEQAVFDYFFRKNPFENGYVLFSGIQELLYTLKQFSFGKEDIDYLRSQGFREPFLQYLSAFTFRGTIRAPVEGEVVFPVEPLLVVKGGVLELQLIETVLLNVLNFSSLISTKASRIRNVTGDRPFSDFGLRRAQGNGGVMASMAAIIGGASSTSNVLAGYHYQLPIGGTMAHSWIQTFDSELEAFRTFARQYPDSCVLLADTYNTLESGVPNAIIVAKEMQEQGHQLKAIRLDSGDLAYFSKKARAMLDAEGLKDVKIVVSNQLDEYVIRSLTLQQAPIDSFGIGTKLITGRDTGALDGVYKLSKYKGEPRMKVSDNIEKTTLPGEKETVRYLHSDGTFYADGVLLAEQKNTKEIAHPHFTHKRTDVSCFTAEPLLKEVMKDGEITANHVTAQQSAAYAQKRLKQLPPEHQRIEFPHHYKVGISVELEQLRDNIFNDIKKRRK